MNGNSSFGESMRPNRSEEEPGTDIGVSHAEVWLTRHHDFVAIAHAMDGFPVLFSLLNAA